MTGARTILQPGDVAVIETSPYSGFGLRPGDEVRIVRVTRPRLEGRDAATVWAMPLKGDRFLRSKEWAFQASRLSLSFRKEPA